MPDLDAASAARQRAVATFEAIRRSRLYSRRHHLYGNRRWLLWRTYEHLWPFADAWSAVAALASLPGQKQASAANSDFMRGAPAYHRGGKQVLLGTDPVGFESSVVPPLGPGGDVFFDDNTWLGLAAIRCDEHEKDTRGLSFARRVLSFVLGGWSTEESWSHPGGIRWKVPNSNTSRNTCSNAPVAQLATAIHERTGDSGTLEWAIRIYSWVRSTLLGPDGLYVDQITPHGALDPTIWSYNQGTMIGAGVQLHRTTGEDSYLEHAVTAATASIAHFTLEVLMKQGAAFNAVYFRNLLLLGELVPDPRFTAMTAAFAEAMWSDVRDPRTGLFPRSGSALNDSAPMIEIFAMLGGATPRP